MEASYRSGFKASVLSKFPLNLSDHHVLSVAVEHGWSDAWMIKEKPRRGQKLRDAAAAQAASGNVGDMLQQQQQMSASAPVPEPSAPLAAAPLAAAPASAAAPPAPPLAAAPLKPGVAVPAEGAEVQPDCPETPRTPELSLQRQQRHMRGHSPRLRLLSRQSKYPIAAFALSI